MRLLKILVGGLVLAVSLPLTAVTASADAAVASFALLDAGPSCSPGVEVLKAPGPNGSPGITVFKSPGPIGCPAGVLVTKQPGPTGVPGSAFALPLNAADCADGTAALTDLLGALGGSPIGTGPGAATGTASDCPAGDAASASIDALVESTPGPIQCPAGTIASIADFGEAGPGPVGRNPGSAGAGDLVTRAPGPTGCPPGTLVLRQPGPNGRVGGLVSIGPDPSQEQRFRISPSSVPGESTLDPIG